MFGVPISFREFYFEKARLFHVYNIIILLHEDLQ